MLKNEGIVVGNVLINEDYQPPKSASLFMRSYACSTGWVISTFAGWFNFDPMTRRRLGRVEPSRSAVLAPRENRDHQRTTGAVYRASFSTGGYRGLTPRFLPVSI
jgi:hypothetical protein